MNINKYVNRDYVFVFTFSQFHILLVIHQHNFNDGWFNNCNRGKIRNIAEYPYHMEYP